MKKTSHILIQVWAACFLLPWACTVGPEYRRPETAAEQASAYQNVLYGVAAVLEAKDFSQWWRQMGDPWMNRSVNRLLEQNIELKEAAARIQQAWAQLGIQRGEALPALSASASASRSFQPIESFGGASGLPFPAAGGNDRIYFTQLETGLSTSWQLDLFGRVERASTAARERYLASRAEAEALIHSLIAELARRRAALSTLQRRIAVVEETIRSRKLTLDFVEGRYRRGVGEVSAGDVYLARENLASAAADLPDLRGQLMEEVYAVDVLLGLAPGTSDPFQEDIPALPPLRQDPAGVPAQLLDRRPDLQASELRLAASVEEIGVAIADLYPDLTLSGNIGLQSSELEDFFDSGNLAGSILGDVMVRLFEGGRLRAAIDLQEAQAREQAAAYARQVLNAMEEVEVALSNARFLSERLEQMQVQLRNIRRAEEEGWENYRRGLRPLLEVLELQRRRYAAEQNRLITAQAAWNNRIALYLALGGDWLSARPALEPVSLPITEELE